MEPRIIGSVNLTTRRCVNCRRPVTDRPIYPLDYYLKDTTLEGDTRLEKVVERARTPSIKKPGSKKVIIDMGGEPTEMCEDCARQVGETFITTQGLRRAWQKGQHKTIPHGAGSNYGKPFY